MKKETTKVNNGRGTPKTVVAALLAFVLLCASMAAYAWFYVGRRTAAITEISNPTAIFINTGNEEDIRYLDLGGIDAEAGTYKDFVFCVRGNNVGSYKLQLAYTTNNQFEFEVYAATESASAPAGASTGVVIYDTHDDVSSTLYYSAPAGASPIPGELVNDTVVGAGDEAETLALTGGDRYYAETYTPSGSNSPYANHHKHAVPLYWQATAAIQPTLDEHFDFCDYYILRVKWTANTKNDKETDIVYISAKNISY